MLGAVQNLALIVPVGLLLGIVLGLGRLYHDSEMTAAQACGAGIRPVLGPILGFTAVLAAFIIGGPLLALMIFPEAPPAVVAVGGLVFGIYAALCAVPQKFM